MYVMKMPKNIYNLFCNGSNFRSNPDTFVYCQRLFLDAQLLLNASYTDYDVLFFAYSIVRQHKYLNIAFKSMP